MKGTVLRLNLDKGFGFIESAEGGDNLFFHCSNLVPTLEFNGQLEHLRVMFDVQEGPKGLRAVNIRPDDGADEPS